MLGKALVRHAPVIGSVYSVTKTAMDVYNTTSPAQALTVAAKGVLIDCVPPHVKYPALCGALALCSVACITTGGNPYVVSTTVNLAGTIFQCSCG
jgi:hypothetical protein